MWYVGHPSLSAAWGDYLCTSSGPVRYWNRHTWLRWGGIRIADEEGEHGRRSMWSGRLEYEVAEMAWTSRLSVQYNLRLEFILTYVSKSGLKYCYLRHQITSIYHFLLKSFRCLQLSFWWILVSLFQSFYIIVSHPVMHINNCFHCNLRLQQI